MPLLGSCSAFSVQCIVKILLLNIIIKYNKYYSNVIIYVNLNHTQHPKSGSALLLCTGTTKPKYVQHPLLYMYTLDVIIVSFVHAVRYGLRAIHQ